MRRKSVRYAMLTSFIASILFSQITVTARPDVIADQWIVVDAATGTILAAESPDVQRPMASLTKVMTAVVALERGHLELPVTITQGDKVPEASAGIFVGTETSLQTLLYGLLLASGNDAAMAIARAVGGSAAFENDGARAQFVVWMNEKAQELGMHDTSFQNPHGLDQEGHYSTPRDLATLTQYALTIPEFREIFGAEEFAGEGYVFSQTNQLPTLIDSVVGGKTGWTDGCGRCLIEVVEINGRDYIIVVMGSDLSWYSDAAAIVTYTGGLSLPADTIDRAGAVFDTLWQRSDSLVAAGVAERSWLWGMPLDEIQEIESAESETGTRFERLYEKGSMEVNHPYSRMDSGWYVTPGRLAAGLIASGAQIPVAGDLAGRGPTYADLQSIARANIGSGEPVTLWLSPNGEAIDHHLMAINGVVAGESVSETGFRTATVFEEYLWQTSDIVEGGVVEQGLLFDPPVFAVGFPVTDPFWVTVPENGTFVDVLVQCFERRCLTYTPEHDPDWQVEMSNIGLHYQIWTSNPESSNAARTPVASPAADSRSLVS